MCRDGGTQQHKRKDGRVLRLCKLHKKREKLDPFSVELKEGGR